MSTPTTLGFVRVVIGDSDFERHRVPHFSFAKEASVCDGGFAPLFTGWSLR